MKVQAILLWHYYKDDRKIDSSIEDFKGSFEEMDKLVERRRISNRVDSRIAILQQIVLLNWKL